MAKAEDRRSTFFLMRMSPRERATIARNAHECNLSISEFLRRCALGKPLSTQSDAEAVSELKRQGGLIKHLASTDRQNAYEYRVALNRIHEAIQRICSGR
jgi:hypothetical protein